MYTIEQIEQNIAAAMKKGDKVATSVWRALKNEMLVFKTAKGGSEVTEEVQLRLIKRMLSQREDSISQYNAAGRTDLAKDEQAEVDILKTLLPKEPSEGDIRILLINTITNLRNNNDEVTMRDMKTIQTVVKETYPTADGGVVARLFKELI